MEVSNINMYNILKILSTSIQCQSSKTLYNIRKHTEHKTITVYIYTYVCVYVEFTRKLNEV